jgi:hypothetical protein
MNFPVLSLPSIPWTFSFQQSPRPFPFMSPISLFYPVQQFPAISLLTISLSFLFCQFPSPFLLGNLLGLSISPISLPFPLHQFHINYFIFPVFSFNQYFLPFNKSTFLSINLPSSKPDFFSYINLTFLLSVCQSSQFSNSPPLHLIFMSSEQLIGSPAKFLHPNAWALMKRNWNWTKNSVHDACRDNTESF